MQFFSALSENHDADDAAREVIETINAPAAFGIDVVFVFFTGDHRERANEILERLWLELDPQALIGCAGEGIIGAGREVERTPGLAVVAAHLPNVRLHPFHIAGQSAWHELIEDEDVLKEKLGLGPETRAVIAMGDPFTSPIDALIGALDTTMPGLPLIGGLASAARRPGDNVLFRNDQMLSTGTVGISLSGPIDVQTVVSQGCRPIGQPMVITKARENVIQQLGGKPALGKLQEVVNELPPRDRALLENGLLIGRVMTEYRETFTRGDFLVRNVVGVGQNDGAIALADMVRVGQTVQFHVRDAESATEDLTLLLEQSSQTKAAGGLLFSCNGRGSRLFGHSDHDSSAVATAMPRTPIAGFFAAGELGPVGGKNFLHGHTASLVLFSPPASK